MTTILSYIVHHWRGTVSMVHSFWVNFIFVCLANQYGANFFLESLAESVTGTNGDTIFRLMSLVWSVYITIFIWASVGVWRSASRERKLGGRNKALAGLIQFFVALIACVFVWQLTVWYDDAENLWPLAYPTGGQTGGTS